LKAKGKDIENAVMKNISQYQALLDVVTNDKSIPMIITLSNTTKIEEVKSPYGSRYIMQLNINDLFVDNEPQPMLDSNKLKKILIEQLVVLNKDKKRDVEKVQIKLHDKVANAFQNMTLELAKGNPSEKEIINSITKLRETIYKGNNPDKDYISNLELKRLVEEYNQFIQKINPEAKLVWTAETKTINKSNKLYELGVRGEIINTLALNFNDKRHLVLCNSKIKIEGIDVDPEFEEVNIVPQPKSTVRNVTPGKDGKIKISKDYSQERAPKIVKQKKKIEYLSNSIKNPSREIMVKTIAEGIRNKTIPVYLDGNTIDRLVTFNPDGTHFQDVNKTIPVTIDSFIKDLDLISEESIIMIHNYYANVEAYKEKYPLIKEVSINALAHFSHSYREYRNGRPSRHNIFQPHAVDLNFTNQAGVLIFDFGTMEEKKQAIDMIIDMGNGQITQIGTNWKHNDFNELKRYIGSKGIHGIEDGPMHAHITLKAPLRAPSIP
jgi:hypothetical protein